MVDYLSCNPKPDLVTIGWTCLGRMETCTGIDDNGDYEYSLHSSWENPEWDKENRDRYKQLLPQLLSEDLLIKV